MYCKNCGKEINNKAVICVNCGVETDVYMNVPGNQQGGLAEDTVPGWLIAICILIPIVGIILGIIKLSMCASESGKKCIIYSIISMVVCSVLYALLYSLGFGVILASM